MSRTAIQQAAMMRPDGEQRRHHRVGLHTTLAVSPFGISEINDISEGGISVSSLTSSVGLSDELQFDILSSCGRQVRGLTARIIWNARTSPGRSGASQVYISGAEFVGLSSLQRSELQQIILLKANH